MKNTPAIFTHYTGQWYQACYTDTHGATQFFWHADRVEAIMLALHHARANVHARV